MGKLLTFTLIIATVLVGFNLAGLIHDTPSQVMINLIKNPESIQSNDYYLAVIGLFGAVGGLGIVIGSVLGDRVQWALTTGLALFFLSITFEIIPIFNLIAQLSIPLAILLVGIPFFGYIFVVVEWWLNKD